MRRHRRDYRGRGYLARMLNPLLLILMQNGPAHVYTLLSQIEKFGFKNIDPSMVYRSMRQMEMQGIVESAWDETETQGPPRRVYHLTPFGNERLNDYIEDLKDTREMIDSISDVYDEHMNKR